MHRLPASLLIAAVALAAATLDASAQATPAPPAFRLPDGARPAAYALTLTIVPAADAIPGEIAIDVELARAHPVLWLNADDVKVMRAAVEVPGTRVDVLSGHEQFVGLAFDPPLPAGPHRV